MGKKINYLWPTILATVLALGVFLGGKLNFNDSPEKLFTTNSKKDKLNRLIDYIDYEYVDEINTDSIVDITVNNILEKLDPHSVYIPKEEMTEVSENMKGDFVGIGINFYKYKDTISVIRTIDKGPSFLKGIKAGDRILMANNDTLFGRNIPNDVIVEKLKGAKGSSVKLQVYRKTEDKTFIANVKRDIVPIKSVQSYYMLTDDIGYIKVNRFAEPTFKEFKAALKDLQKQGAKKLTLDLRDNPGGYLGVAEQMADEFLDDGKLILFTKNKKGKVNKVFATDEGSFEDKPIYVLINERSASASEIIAGALQDNDIGTIVGRRSFGKGLVQREMELGDGSAVRLTVSRYYTPTGRSIQRTYKNGHKSLKFQTPKGKLVYGGGGIIPDEFVPIGTNEEEAVESMDSYGWISYFIFEHLDEDRNRYTDYAQEDFVANFRVDDVLFEKFIDYLMVRRFKMSFYDYEDSIKLYLKAALAEQLFGANVHAKIKSSADKMLQRVLELDNPLVKQEEAEEIETTN